MFEPDDKIYEIGTVPFCHGVPGHTPVESFANRFTAEKISIAKMQYRGGAKKSYKIN